MSKPAQCSPESAPDNPLALGGQLCFSVYSAAHAFTRLYTVLLQDLGLTYTQYLVLLVLWEEGGLTVKEIGSRLHLDSGTLTPVLRRLENAGYVERRRDETDRRRIHIHLRESGHDLQAQVAAARQVVFEATGLSADELMRLRAELEAVCASLDRAVHEHGGEEPSDAPVKLDPGATNASEVAR